MAATLYVIPGSHACRTASLMLEYKSVPYDTVELPTGLHPLLVRTRGFAGHRSPIRTVDGGTHRELAILDRLGTVPALRLGGERIQTNREIARRLELAHPEPPLFPADPARRRKVEEAERWGDEVLQMAARRVALASAASGLDAIHRRGADGRLGALLTRSDRLRGPLSRMAGRSFRANPHNERALIAAVPALLDRVDAWIEQGVLCGDQLNAADFAIAPSLALLSYRPGLDEELSRRPAGALIDRLLPEPAAVP